MMHFDIPYFLKLLETNQAEGGGFYASAYYPPYQKCWLRDHAHATRTLVRYGRTEPAQRAIGFIDNVFKKELPVVRNTLEKIEREPSAKYGLSKEHHPRARYHPDCSYVREEEWGDTQHDGPALCLVALAEYADARGDYGVMERESTTTMINYLSQIWDVPSNCAWEMFGDFLHSYTLGAVYCALEKCEKFSDDPHAAVRARRSIKESILRDFVRNGVLKKMQRPFGEPVGTDASALWLFSDFGVFSADRKEEREVMEKTLGHTYQTLSHDAIGLKRYRIEEWDKGGEDRYFGGGTWMNVTLLGATVRHKLGIGNANGILDYFGKNFPEQLLGDEHVFDSAERDAWVRGSLKNYGVPGPATPLAWSISSYLDLLHELYGDAGQ